MSGVALGKYKLLTVIAAALLAFILFPYRSLVSSRLSSALGSFNRNTTAAIVTSSQEKKTTMPRGAVIGLSHGGGPLPLLGQAEHKDIITSLKTKVPALLKLGTADQPRAIILVTAHWSERNPSISNASRHPLYFDYYGFPPETYKYKYDAPGSPEIAAEIANALKSEGLKPEMDGKRGWDHGVFVPMMLINPKADVPIVQLSVLESENGAEHFAMGRALNKLRDSNIAIIGSGFASFHNLRLQFSGLHETPAFKSRNEAWSKALGQALAETDPAEREKKMVDWRKLPGATEMHPINGGEHFMPLIVCAGAAGQGQMKSYSDNYIGMKMWSYYWE